MLSARLISAKNIHIEKNEKKNNNAFWTLLLNIASHFHNSQMKIISRDFSCFLSPCCCYYVLFFLFFKCHTTWYSNWIFFYDCRSESVLLMKDIQNIQINCRPSELSQYKLQHDRQVFRFIFLFCIHIESNKQQGI